MSATSMEFEKATLDHLRSDFEAKGYRFWSNPAGDQLPRFLGPYRPDAIAIGPNDTDKVIIEVKPSRVDRTKVPLPELSRTAATTSGWRYLLVYAGQDPSEIVELSRPSKAQVDAAIQEVRGLERSDYLRAALLEGWSLLEALARRIYPDDIRVSLKPLSPAMVVERLAMDGQIDDEDAKRLRAVGSIRNAVAHGDLNVQVSPDALRHLLDQVEAVNANIPA